MRPVGCSPCRGGQRPALPSSLCRILQPMGFIFDLLFAGLGDKLGRSWVSRHHRKFGRIGCRVRVIAGAQEGLRGRWQHSRARVYPGRLDFGRRTPTEVHVRAVVTERQREPHWPDVLWVDPEFQIVELTTDSATLEWAVDASNLDWALARVQGAGGPST